MPSLITRIQLHMLFWLGGSPERLAELYKTHTPVPLIQDGPSNPTDLCADDERAWETCSTTIGYFPTVCASS
jgi:hypothetical protein